MIIQELYKNTIRWINKRRVIRDLIKHNRYMLEMETILESWITKRILDGQTGRREELIKKQASIKEIEAILEWLKTQ